MLARLPVREAVRSRRSILIGGGVRLILQGAVTTEELAQRVIDAGIAELRQTSFIPFWQGTLDVTPRSELEELFQESRSKEGRILEVLKQAASKRSRPSFELKVEGGRRDYYGNSLLPSVLVSLREGFEWSDVIREAWSGTESVNPWFLTGNAVRMLEWLQGPKNTGEFASGNRIGSQAGLRGTGSYSMVESYLKEISLKTPHGVEIERSSRYGGDYKAKLVAKDEGPERAGIQNPVFTGKLLRADRDSREAYARMLEDRVLEGEFGDRRGCLLFRIHSRSELLRTLPDIGDNPTAEPGDVVEFLEKVRLPRGLKVAATLEDQADEGWRIGAVLEDGWDWESARASILEQRERRDPRITHGLSEEAAKILQWLWGLHDGELELGMSPCVEEVAREQIGIQGLGHDQNSGVVLGLLVDEINEKCPYRLRLIPWSQYGGDYHRILFRSQEDPEEQLIRRIGRARFFL